MCYTNDIKYVTAVRSTFKNIVYYTTLYLHNRFMKIKEMKGNIILSKCKM